MQTKTVALGTPLTFGDQTISELTLRRPNAGDLRGIKLTNVQEMEVSTLLALLPRISLTPVAKDTLNGLDPADVVALYACLADFFTALTEPSPKTH
jgi:hypothetical protein